MTSLTSRIDAVLFDVDGTLFDRDRAQQETCRVLIKTFPDLFANISPENAMRAFQKSDEEATRRFDNGEGFEISRTGRMNHFLSLLQLDTNYADAVNRVYVEKYPLADVPIDNAREVVTNLAKRFRLGAISNGIPDVQYQKLKTLGIDRFMHCVVLSEEFGIRKPDERIFHRALEEIKTDAGRSVYVGDSFTRDVIGAKNAGMMAVWFNPENDSAPEHPVRPDYVIHRLAELPAILENTHE